MTLQKYFGVKNLYSLLEYTKMLLLTNIKTSAKIQTILQKEFEVNQEGTNLSFKLKYEILWILHGFVGFRSQSFLNSCEWWASIS